MQTFLSCRFQWPQVEKVWKGHRHSNARHLDWGWMNIRLIAHRILYSSLTHSSKALLSFLCCNCYVLLPLQLWRAFMPSILAQKSMLFTLLSLCPASCSKAKTLQTCCCVAVLTLYDFVVQLGELQRLTFVCLLTEALTLSLLSRGSQICFQLGQSVLHASHQRLSMKTYSFPWFK